MAASTDSSIAVVPRSGGPGGSGGRAHAGRRALAAAGRPGVTAAAAVPHEVHGHSADLMGEDPQGGG